MYQSLGALFTYGVKAAFEQYLFAKGLRIVGDGTLLMPARAACEQLYHFGEHYRQMHDSTMQPRRIRELCAAYSLIGNVTDAAKHQYINKHEPVISRASQLHEAILTTIFSDQQGLFQHSDVITLAILDNGDRIDLLDTMSQVYCFWAQLLFEQELLPEPLTYQHLPQPRLSRQQANTFTEQVTIRAQVGVPFSVYHLYQQYNPELGRYVYLDSPKDEPLRFRVSLSSEPPAAPTHPPPPE